MFTNKKKRLGAIPQDGALPDINPMYRHINIYQPRTIRFNRCKHQLSEVTNGGSTAFLFTMAVTGPPVSPSRPSDPAILGHGGWCPAGCPSATHKTSMSEPGLMRPSLEPRSEELGYNMDIKRLWIYGYHGYMEPSSSYGIWYHNTIISKI